MSSLRFFLKKYSDCNIDLMFYFSGQLAHTGDVIWILIVGLKISFSSAGSLDFLFHSLNCKLSFY